MCESPNRTPSHAFPSESYTPGSKQKEQHDPEDDERRIQQRQKQIQYGFNTDGYKNMQRLINAYPQLKNGGVLPINPPASTLKTSKRTWDVLIRKWRRALHMFDFVYIDEEDEGTKTIEEVIDQQRQKWVSSHYQDTPATHRKKLSAKEIMALRDSAKVPKKLPVEENMMPILRSMSCYEPMFNVVPEANPMNRGGGVSPHSAGIKIFIAPTNQSGGSTTQARTASPVRGGETPPTAVVKSRNSSPVQRGTSPTRMAPSSSSSVAYEGSGGCETPSTKLEHRFVKVANTPPPYNQTSSSSENVCK